MALSKPNQLTEQENNQDFNEALKKDYTLKILIRILGFGITAIFLVSLYTAFTGDTMRGLFPVLGLSLAIGIAAALSGGFLGFLFGIPKSLQRNQVTFQSSVDPVTGKALPPSTNRIFISNTNLEEISDWLTKIIVGVSLIQLTKIIKFYGDSCRSLARSFKGYMNLDFGFSYSGSLIIFFSVCGFLIVYLWARVYFLKQLNELERSLEGVLNKVTQAINTQDVKIEKEKLERKIDDFNKERNKVTTSENKEDVKLIVELAKPGPVTVLNDCQKNRWGSSSVNGAYSLVASVVQNINDPELFHVTATVNTNNTTGNPITGNVYFMLHDSFYPNSIMIANSVGNNTASCTFDSYEAFTIGAVLNGGAVKLELDLNQDPAVPADYKYPDKLETIDELKSKLKELNDAEN